jgi:hypothetical protein
MLTFSNSVRIEPGARLFRTLISGIVLEGTVKKCEKGRNGSWVVHWLPDDVHYVEENNHAGKM